MQNNDSSPWFLEPGVTLLVATRDPQGRPRISRAVTARRAPDGTGLIVYISMPAGLDSIGHIIANGTVAVVFARPSDYRSVQFKGTNARIIPTTEEDAAFVRERFQSTVGFCAALGLPAQLLERLFSAEGAVAVAFTPSGAWEQTPGLDAGREVPL